MMRWRERRGELLLVGFGLLVDWEGESPCGPPALKAMVGGVGAIVGSLRCDWTKVVVGFDVLDGLWGKPLVVPPPWGRFVGS